jgi:integrase
MQLRMGSVKNGRLEYEMDKTGHRKSIPLNEKSKAIFNLYFDPKVPKHYYLFPCLDNNAPYAEFVTYEQKKKMPRELQVMLFNHCSSNATMVNQALVKISEKIGLDKPARFHSNRHSFADKARRKMKSSRKVTLMDIKNSLGHKSVVTTERYMKRLDKESLDEAMGEIFD